MSLLMSFVGIVVLLAIAVLLSDNRKAINLRTVGGAFAIQFLIGGFVLYIPWGREMLSSFSAGVQNVINYGKDGTSFLFGSLVNFSVDGLGFIFAFQVLPAVIFFCSLIAVLYYTGIMPLIIRIIGGGLQRALGTSKAESMSAAANIFVGQTEAPLVVKPYIAKMTQSELFAIMCGGLASIAGSVLAGYAAMGVRLEYLVAASFMAAPGGLLFAKIMKPETEVVADDDIKDFDHGDDKPSNLIDAAAGGASMGLSLALNIGAMLLAFIGLIALVNGMLGGIGSFFHYPGLSLELILGWVFAPLAWLIGVPWSEATIAGSFIGQKVILNEFVAYSNFLGYMKDSVAAVANSGVGSHMSEKTTAIISFALCGFANLSSVAILLGGLGGMAPNRRHDVARMGIKAVIAGTLSNLMAATIAGLFLSF